MQDYFDLSFSTDASVNELTKQRSKSLKLPNQALLFDAPSSRDVSLPLFKRQSVKKQP
jgi:hypothetical protein